MGVLRHVLGCGKREDAMPDVKEAECPHTALAPHCRSRPIWQGGAGDLPVRIRAARPLATPMRSNS
jgi:hypothetical protein